MAFYELEPFGDLVADQRHGIATAVLANVNRDAKRTPDPYQATDFIYWHDVHRKPVNQDGELLADPEAQARLIKQMLFKSNG
jgi:hypothetical protein